MDEETSYGQALRNIPNGEFTEDPEVLKLATIEGWTVAHLQALEGWRTENPEILAITADNNWTVAQAMEDYIWLEAHKGK